MNASIWKLELRKMVTDKKFIAVFAAVFFLYLIDTVEKMFFYSGWGKGGVPLVDLPAASLIPFHEWRILIFIYAIFAPFFAGLQYADNYARERSSSVYLFTVNRSGRGILVIKGTLVFLSTFFTFLIPSVLSQLTYLLFAPSRSVALWNSWVLYRPDFSASQRMYCPALYEFSPYLANLFAALRVALFFAVFALLVYSILLFFHKRSWIILLAGGVVYFVWSFLVGSMGCFDLVPMNYFFTVINDGAEHLWIFAVILLLMLTASLVLIFIKVRVKKDEL